jgi:hypothetical protein
MSLDELSKKLGRTPETILKLQRAFPGKAPKSFGNLQSWKVFMIGRGPDRR